MSRIRLVLVLVLVLAPATDSGAVGISIDAGLTPPEGRWILRTQLRSMERNAPDALGDSGMERLMIPFVVAHGLRPQLTVGLRQTFTSSTMTMMGNEIDESGFGDLYVFAKYKALRINTRDYTLGIAPLVGIEAPTGGDGISSEAWSVASGLLFSGRVGNWGADLNLSYGFRGIAGVADDRPEPGDELGVDLALARQIPVGRTGRISVAPVLEISWKDTAPARTGGADLADSGESVLYAAPGAKYTRGDVIVEGLVRFAVAQDQEGMQMEAGNMYLIGVRWMF